MWAGSRKVLGTRGDSARRGGLSTVFFQFFHEVHVQEGHIKYLFAELGVTSNIDFPVDDES